MMLMVDTENLHDVDLLHAITDVLCLADVIDTPDVCPPDCDEDAAHVEALRAQVSLGGMPRLQNLLSLLKDLAAKAPALMQFMPQILELVAKASSPGANVSGLIFQALMLLMQMQAAPKAA